MSQCCPPAPAPFDKYPNCPTEFVRACTDGTGTVVGSVAGGEFFAATPELAQFWADQLARGRALNKVLICNTLSPGDLAGCGLVEERPSVIPGCNPLCTETGFSLCTESGDQINSIVTI